ncbi:MAG: HEAT repeat domain-containing protein [Anaerolineales bacterium]|nr:HEAT repeat domain-containing protein [Chloroflexota bacterium]MBL6980324.1 HEAT repeat domain-containing protein [Anaerolineales bacterium]
MTDLNPLNEAPFQDIIEALLNADTILDPQLLFRLSDLEGEDIETLKTAWPNIPDWRRRALLEDIEELAEGNLLLSFESVCRIAIDDEDPQVRFLAIRPMFIYEPEDLLYQLMNILETDEDENVRACCASTLGKFVFLGEIENIPDDTTQDLVNCLLKVTKGNDSTQVRRRALEALGFASSKEVPKLIEAALLRDGTDWLISALFAMGRTCDKRWNPNVISMLNHQLPAVRFEAVKAAGELEISDAVEELIDLLNDSNDDVRLAAAWSLSQIGGEGVKDALEKLMKANHNYEEVGLIQDALDNLMFNEDMELFGLLEFSNDDDF